MTLTRSFAWLNLIIVDLWPWHCKVCRGALMRTECRGGQVISTFPSSDFLHLNKKTTIALSFFILICTVDCFSILFRCTIISIKWVKNIWNKYKLKMTNDQIQLQVQSCCKLLPFWPFFWVIQIFRERMKLFCCLIKQKIAKNSKCKNNCHEISRFFTEIHDLTWQYKTSNQ